MFVQLAALAGCDYVDNVKGLGLITALPIVSKFKRVQADRRVTGILTHLRETGKTVSFFFARFCEVADSNRCCFLGDGGAVLVDELGRVICFC